MLFLPIGVLIACSIKLTSAGPIFFTQERPGFQKNIFTLYKFRSMKNDSNIMVKGKEVLKDDCRVTMVGKFLRRTKLDEIPQLINVLSGEMSLVGPRPERLDSLEEYDEEISKRLNMRPGLTGLAQVSGNIYINLQRRYEFDVHYVENFNLLLDFKIILRTIGVILFGEERYANKPLVFVSSKAKVIEHTAEPVVIK